MPALMTKDQINRIVARRLNRNAGEHYRGVPMTESDALDWIEEYLREWESLGDTVVLAASPLKIVS